MPDTPPHSGGETPWDAEQRARAELRAKYVATIRRLWKEPDDCPICKKNQWNIGDLVETQLRYLLPDQFPTYESLVSRALPVGPTAVAQPSRIQQVYLYVPVTCLVCGYTLFFHSGVLDARAADIAETAIQATSAMEAAPKAPGGEGGQP